MYMRRTKVKPSDGLGPLEIKKIRGALRLVWHRSHARKLAVKRCMGMDGFSYCEKCHKATPALKIDHIHKCGDVDGGYIKRLFTPSKNLQGLCHSCHKIKTKDERNQSKKKRAVYTEDFY
jgi:hypothetical protein